MQLLPPDNYQEYVNSQCERSRKTAGLTWATKQSIESVAEIIGKAEFGICHGAKSGFEVDLLRKLIEAEIIGTDICEQEHKAVIKWDFHNVRRSWIAATDFIYSNSLDHSYAPQFALSQWVTCLKEGGLLFLEWSPDHDGEPTPADCFQASLDEYKTMVSDSLSFTKTLSVGDRNILVGRKQ